MQPLTKDEFSYRNMFDSLLHTDYILQLHQSPSAGGNISKVTLLNQLNVPRYSDDGWMHVYYMGGIPFPAEPASFQIQGG